LIDNQEEEGRMIMRRVLPRGKEEASFKSKKR
jgi:hypothetical protein